MIRTLLLALFCSTYLVACSPQRPSSPALAYQPNTLRVFATYPGFNYLPFYAWTEGNAPIGFEPELAQLLAEQLRMKVAFVYPREAAKQDPRVYALERNIADIALFTFPATKRTKNIVGLSKPYASDGIGVLVASKSPIRSARDLDGKRLLAFEHTSANSWASRRFPNAQILPEYPERFEGSAVDLLEDNIVDAFLMGREHLQWVAKDSSAVRILPEQRSREVFAVAVDKQNTRLLQRVNMALSALEANGKLEALRRKWLIGEQGR